MLELPECPYEPHMRRALALAEVAEQHGEVPVGALVVRDGEIIGEGYNSPISHNDPSAHAEIRAIRQACEALGNYRLLGCQLYVTLEPCTMCLGAMMHARLEELIYGASEPRAGAVVSRLHLPEQRFYNHQLRWRGGILAEQSRALLQRFFAERRERE